MDWVVVRYNLDNPLLTVVSSPRSKYAAKKLEESWIKYYGLVNYDFEIMKKEEYEAINQ